jgi:hypothetical protein
LSDLPIWKRLTDAEFKLYKKWARDNYQIGSKIPEVWHPVVRAECVKMNDEWQSTLKRFT